MAEEPAKEPGGGKAEAVNNSTVPAAAAVEPDLEGGGKSRWVTRQEAGRRDGITVVCLGASNTKGVQGACYVNKLREGLHGCSGRGTEVRVVNAGQNGDFALCTVRRLHQVAVVNPDAVVVLLGSNDVKLELNHAF